MSLIQVVPHCQFLRWIPAFLVDRLDQMSTTRIYSAGETLFSEGQEHPDFHILVEGRVRLEMNVAGLGRVSVLTAERGDILAWSALIGDSVMTTSATAIDAVKTVAIRGKDLQRLCDSEPELGYHVMRQLAASLASRLVATRRQLLELAARSAPPLAEKG